MQPDDRPATHSKRFYSFNINFARAFTNFVALIYTIFAASVTKAADGDIYITFLARPTKPIAEHTPGHAFFCLNLHLSQGIKEDCFGFYPQNALKAFDGPGTVSKEFKKNSIPFVSVSLEHKITEETRRDIYNVIESYAGKDYKLVVRNCEDLVFDVAKSAGLRTPDRNTITLPTEAVEGLKGLYWKGQWQSSDPQSRFQLAVGSGDIGWGERNASGTVLEVKVPFAFKEGFVRVERPNDDKVLTHLGYQPKLRSQILAAGPKPSFLILERVDKHIEAQWNGLVVIKDEKANLKELKQPGTTPPKAYTFDRLP